MREREGTVRERVRESERERGRVNWERERGLVLMVVESR